MELIRTKRRKMSVKEAAEYLGYTVSYMYKLNYTKQVPHHKPAGVNVYYFQDELDDFLDRGRVLTTYELEAAAANVISKMTVNSRGMRQA